jgi:prepilin-type N-terminal cleavage/methylation domain-containing protein
MFFKPKRITINSSFYGFSLIEVMISVAIITIITVIVMIRYSSFNSTVLLKNQAFDLALSIRQVQADAISTKGELILGPAKSFHEGYGVYFDTNASVNSYIIFLDNNNTAGWMEGRYNLGDTILETINLDPRFYISDLCGIRNSGQRECKKSGAADVASIVFTRPSYNADIRVFNGASSVNNIGTVEIELSSFEGPTVTRKILVNIAGLIEVK